MKDERVPVSGLTATQRIALLALNTIPLLHLAMVLCLTILPVYDWSIRLLVSAIVLYVLPPFAVRLIFAFGQISQGSIPLGSKDFFLWWISFQWQMVFNRLPALEEFLRLIPGLYSLWLRLWGAHIGRSTFWAPGTLILDRSFLHVGDDVVFGAGVRINAHVADLDMSGQRLLLLSTIKIGDRCQIGGYSLLTAGTRIESDESTKAFLISPPFSRWQNGKRLRESSRHRVSLKTPHPNKENEDL